MLSKRFSTTFIDIIMFSLQVEDMNSDDFLLSAGLSNDLLVEASTLLEMAISSSLVRVTFLVGQPQYEVSFQCFLL